MPRSLVGALLVIILAIAGPVPTGATAADPARILLVDPSDPTAYATIGEAVAAAHDDDRVLVRPGRYVESVVLDMAVSIEGDGDRSAIVVEGPDPPAFHVLADGASLRGLTLTGGRPPLEGGETVPPGDLWQSSVLALSADASVTDLVIADGAAFGIAVSGSAAPTIVGNDIHENQGGIAVLDSAAPTITDNEIHGSQVGIAVTDSAAPSVTDNDIHENQGGIAVTDSAAPAITDNDIHENQVGIAVTDSAAPAITDNDIHGSQVGIGVGDSAAPTISGNDIHENGMFGVRVSGSAAPTFTGNDIHENGTVGIWVEEGATATIDGREVSGPYTE